LERLLEVKDPGLHVDQPKQQTKGVSSARRRLAAQRHALVKPPEVREGTPAAVWYEVVIVETHRIGWFVYLQEV
jgi:hypothetical protein